jgi:hypothetical protein
MIIGDAEHFFKYLLDYLNVSFRRMSIQAFAIRFFELYILDINCLIDVWFANIFSHSISYFFTVEDTGFQFDIIPFVYFFAFGDCA